MFSFPMRPARPEPDPAEQVVTIEQVVVRLEHSVMQDLRRKVNASALVTSQTTDLQAGFQLGINHVLNVLQEGYTITRS